MQDDLVTVMEAICISIGYRTRPVPSSAPSKKIDQIQDMKTLDQIDFEAGIKKLASASNLINHQLRN